MCPSCGASYCYISLYWNKKQYRFWRHPQLGDSLIFSTAERQLTVMRSQIDAHTFNPADFLPRAAKERLLENKLLDWLSQKEAEMNRNELSFGTQRIYRVYAERFITPLLGKLDVREIRFEQLEWFKDNLPARLSLKYRRNILNALHAFFTWLKRKGIILETPAFPEIKGDDAQVRTAISLEEQLEALKRIPEEHRDAIEFACETGLRVAELCALKLKDISMKDGTALIQRTFSGSRLRETTKGKNKSFIPLSDRAYEIAKKHFERHLKNQVLDFSIHENFLFLNPVTGKGYRMDFLRKIWKQYSGLNVTLYEATRHSFCTQIVESGADVLSARNLMRHADLRSTQNYFHATPKRLQELVNRRGKISSLPERNLNENGR